jgi:general stress protein 26
MQRDIEFEEDFKKAKMVYLITYDSTGKENTRPMTNYSENPYEKIWFPTEKDTQKIKDIENNPNVKVLVPSRKKGFYHQIEGKAMLEDQSFVEENWEWWYLSWRPTQRRWFWFPPGLDSHKRAIIQIKPMKRVLVERRR